MTENIEKTTRNRKLYRDYKKGKSYRELIIKYDISLTRVQQILKREKERESEKPTK